MILAQLATLLVVVGLAQAFAGFLAVRYFAAAPRASPGSELPPVSLLKPLCGDEPGLEQALASFAAQDYPALEIIFGVRDATDPALAVVRRVRAAFPDRDIKLVVDPRLHGGNRKICNLKNMLTAASHDTLVIADSDLHVAPDYLRAVVAALVRPGVGLVTTLVTGRPGVDCAVARLGAVGLSCWFLPGVLLGRWLGRQDNLGTTMALRRDVLARAGGLEALLDEVADDNVLGRRVRALGLDIALAATLPATTVAETRLFDLFAHELRWSRTVRAVAPLGHALSLLQYPLFWAGLLVVLLQFSAAALAVFGLVWALRTALAMAMCRALRQMGQPAPMPGWLLPARELLSVAVVLCSFAGRDVIWRGHRMRATPVSAGLSANSLGMFGR